VDGDSGRRIHAETIDHAMLYLLARFLDICLLRAGPRDLPRSGRILAGTLAVDLALNYVSLAPISTPIWACLQIGTACLLTIGFLYGMLALRGQRPRFLQAASAVFGTDIVVSLVSLVMIFAFGGYHASFSQIAGLALDAVSIWNLIVLGNIFRSAMTLPLPGGILIALLYVIVSGVLTGGIAF